MYLQKIRETAFAMPLTNPSYPPGHYRIVNRECMIITYRTDMDPLRALVPEPPVADLPVLEVHSATRILADLTLGLGRVVRDYMRHFK